MLAPDGPELCGEPKPGAPGCVAPNDGDENDGAAAEVGPNPLGPDGDCAPNPGDPECEPEPKPGCVAPKPGDPPIRMQTI